MTPQRLAPWTGALLLLAGLISTSLAYWPGLYGPLLLDDFGNLSDVWHYLDGARSFEYVLLGNRSGPGGRPIAMATFLADAILWGADVWHFKLTNLLLHLACGVVLYAFLSRCLARDPVLGRLWWMPVLLSVCWLALPINVSAVLYVVQRMAILSALFSLLALFTYVVAREAMERGSRWGTWAIWLVVPVLTVLAFLSKENGLLVPFLLLAVELAWFQPRAGATRPTPVRAWFVVFALVPVILALAVLVVESQRITGGYASREFTLTERLLTQPRVLWHYVGAILVPYGPKLGLFHDAFELSRDWLRPWTTIPANLAWVAVVVLAWKVRARHAAVLGGILIFLAGHAMESTILPLEIYFEHRNYLASIGVLIAAAALLTPVLRGDRPRGSPAAALLTVGILLVPVTLLWAAHARAIVWSSATTLYSQELEYNPQSPRLRSYLAGRAMALGDLEQALGHIAIAERNSPKREWMTATLWRLLAHCKAGVQPPEDLYQELESRTDAQVTRFAMVAWEELAQRAEPADCNGLDVGRLVQAGRRWIENSPRPPSAHEIWRTRYYLARLLASQGRLSEASHLGNDAWIASSKNNGIAVFLFQVNASLGSWEQCRTLLDHLELSYGTGDRRLDEAIDTFRQAFRAERSDSRDDASRS